MINTTNLLVARTLDRHRELAIRVWLGARARHVAGVAVAEVLGLTPRPTAGGMFASSLDVRSALIVSAAALALTVAASLGPTLRASRVDIGGLLRVE